MFLEPVTLELSYVLCDWMFCPHPCKECPRETVGLCNWLYGGCTVFVPYALV